MTGRPLRPPCRTALALLTLVLAKPAAAANAPEPPGRFEVGPFWLTPHLTLRGAGRDTNVYNQAVDPVSDAAAVLTPSLDIALPVGERFRFTGNGFLNFNWFRDETSERSTDRGYMFRGEADAGPATLFGETGRGWYKRRFTIDLDDRLPYRDNTNSAGVKVKLGTRVIATTTVSTSRFEIEDEPDGPDASTTLNRDTRSLALDARYALTPRTSLVASAEWLEDRFDATVGTAPSEVDSGRYLGGFEFKSKGLTGQLLAGVRDFPSSDAAAPSYTGPAVKTNLAFPVGSRARITLEAEREVYYAARTTADAAGSAERNSYVSWRSRGELSLALPFELLARGLFGYEAASYVLPYTGPDGAVDDTTSRFTYGVTLLRLIGDHLRLGGGIVWEHRIGQSVVDPYDGARWGLQAEFTP